MRSEVPSGGQGGRSGQGRGMDGFCVMPMQEAFAIPDFIVTATGDKNIVDLPHFEVMKDGCILANIVYPVPDEIDQMKINVMKISIDTLTEEQEKYLTSWQEGT
ncbi:MAG: adenosylhomocysteinase [Desulforhopalus sp.]